MLSSETVIRKMYIGHLLVLSSWEQTSMLFHYLLVGTTLVLYQATRVCCHGLTATASQLTFHLLLCAFCTLPLRIEVLGIQLARRNRSGCGDLEGGHPPLCRFGLRFQSTTCCCAQFLYRRPLHRRHTEGVWKE